MGDDLEFGVIGVIVRRHNRHGVGFMRRSVLGQFHSALRIGGADVDHHGNPRLGLIERNHRRLFTLFDRHRRPLPRGSQHKQTLHAGFDVKIDQRAHHLLVDADLLIEWCNDRQQYSSNHAVPLSDLRTRETFFAPTGLTPTCVSKRNTASASLSALTPLGRAPSNAVLIASRTILRNLMTPRSDEPSCSDLSPIRPCVPWVMISSCRMLPL